MIELIAKIFGAVSRTISLMRLSALLASKRCRCHYDGFCSDEEQERATLTATLMYKSYMSCRERGSAEVIRYLARLLADDSQRKNEIQPPIRLALDDSRSSGSGEVESHKRLVDCMHTIYDVF